MTEVLPTAVRRVERQGAVLERSPRATTPGADGNADLLDVRESAPPQMIAVGHLGSFILAQSPAGEAPVWAR